MRNFLLNYGSILVIVITVIVVIKTYLLIARYIRNRQISDLLLALLSLGLCYDAIVLTIGIFLAPDRIEGLSRLRYILHGALIPLILPISLKTCGLGKKPMIAVYVITALLSIAGIVEGFVTELEVSTIANVNRYMAAEATPAWAHTFSRIMSFGSVVPLIIGGIYLIIKKKNWWMLLSGLVMLLFSALGPITGNTDLIFMISMPGELLMMIFLAMAVHQTAEE